MKWRLKPEKMAETVVAVLGVLSYEYDTAGNRLRQSVNGVVWNYTYNQSNNELLGSSSYTCQGGCHYVGGGSYTCDSDGSLASKWVNQANVNWAFSWDPQNRLDSVANNTGVQGYYAYEGSGRRLESKEATTTTFYAYQATETLSELVYQGFATDYVYAQGLRIARITTQAPYYYHPDALGSTRLVTDAKKNILFTDSYQPFGQDNGTPTGSETYKFTGKPVSQTTGLY